MLTMLEYKGVIQNWEFSDNEGETYENIANTDDTYSFMDVPTTRYYRAIVLGCNSSVDTTDAYVLQVTAAACDKIIIANLVTPNNDNRNDTWLIEDIESYPPISVEIYNRFGKELYRNDKYDNSWDAAYQGQALQDGTYYYVLRIEGNSKVFKGAVNVMR